MKARGESETIEQRVILAFFRAFWWLLRLPFVAFRRRNKLSVDDKKYLILRQRKIKALMSSNNNAELYQAIIEADKLIDWILKKRGYSGRTFADRLRNAQKDIPQNIYNNIWYGHKIRNKIVHEDGSLRPEELRAAIERMLTYNG